MARAGKAVGRCHWRGRPSLSTYISRVSPLYLAGAAAQQLQYISPNSPLLNWLERTRLLLLKQRLVRARVRLRVRARVRVRVRDRVRVRVRIRLRVRVRVRGRVWVRAGAGARARG